MANNSTDSSTIFSQYTIFLSKLADELTKYNLKKLKFLMKDFLPAGAIEKIDSPHCYMETLEKIQVIHKNDLRYLCTALGTIGRNDLAKRVLTFINESAELGIAPELHKTNAISTKHNIPSSSNAEKQKISYDFNNFVQNSSLQYALNQLSYTTKQDELHIKEVQFNNLHNIYAMERVPCGICHVILNSFIYEVESEDGKLLKSRLGTEKDAILLCNTFSWLNFEVVEHRNLEAKNILKVIRGNKNTETDCFVCCILSHGFNDGVYGSDGKKVTFQEMKIECSADWLLNKPKIFFVQADEMEEVSSSRTQSTEPNYSFSNEASPNENSDFCFLVATPTEKFDYRCSDGSWYVKTLCHILKKHSISLSLSDMLQKLSDKMSKIIKKANGEVSVEEILSIHSNTLRKHLYFKPQGLYIDKTLESMSIEDKKSAGS